jgi:hypothetical protein
MTIATQLRDSLQKANAELARQGGGGELLTSIEVTLSKVQRRYLAEVIPERTDCLSTDASGMRSVSMPIDVWIELAAKLESNRQTESGSRKNAAAGSLKAIEKATLGHCQRMASVGTVYRLRIELDGIDPAIWRSIEVPDCSLFDLHHAIQASMGWENSHMFAFTIGATDYLGSPMGGSDGIGPGKNAAKFSISDALGRERRFAYEYDFGDSWRHTIVVEDAASRPLIGAGRCLAGENACPPEDCGGIYGYYELVELLRDPNLTAEDDERIEWYEDFDPNAFDVAGANAILQRMFGSQ